MPPLPAALHTAQKFVDNIFYHLYTAFLFTKSDIKTTLIPITFFATAAAPITDIARLPHVMFWIWLHLLQFDVSNQTMSPEEDEMNKKDRPLPSKRLTLDQALILRYLLVPACFLVSIAYSVEALYASISLVFLTFLYDELGAHSAHWAIRNAVNAGGFAAFEAGATLLAGRNPHRLDNIGILAICFSAGIFATTIQSQDFKDEEGDRMIGRKTIPIMFPTIGRYTVIVPMAAWSVGLSIFWKLDLFTSAVFVCLALWVGGRFVVLRSVPADQVTFYWYNVWLSAAHALPGYYHLFVKGL
ncbi:hypothetical protein CPC08DRAFT_736438 [Agrocybe pediades]|nr:hypothetical protein CPC08DRAFT_736438 [Agrocybe pediades]